MWDEKKLHYKITSFYEKKLHIASEHRIFLIYVIICLDIDEFMPA